MIKIYLIIIFLILFSSVRANNSIYFFSKSAKTFSIASIHSISDNINGLFYQPISKQNNIDGNSFFSYSEIYNNQFSVFQLGYCLKNNTNTNVSIGFIKRDIDDLFNTSSAWDYNQHLIPNLNDIDYENISRLLYEDIGFVISYNKYYKNKIINLKLKPYYNKIHLNESFGIDIDLMYSMIFNKYNFILGIENLISEKKWDNGVYERNNIRYFLSNSIKLNQITFFSEINNIESPKFGLEYDLNNIFCIRFGYDKENKETLGFGLSSILFDINYAYFNSESNLGISNQISILFKTN
tara:strand:- start:213 stop:1100 length:888 start_codon:yes stop_codon:yes gene_type:complete